MVIGCLFIWDKRWLREISTTRMMLKMCLLTCHTIPYLARDHQSCYTTLHHIHVMWHTYNIVCIGFMCHCMHVMCTGTDWWSNQWLQMQQLFRMLLWSFEIWQKKFNNNHRYSYSPWEMGDREKTKETRCWGSLVHEHGLPIALKRRRGRRG